MSYEDTTKGLQKVFENKRTVKTHLFVISGKRHTSSVNMNLPRKQHGVIKTRLVTRWIHLKYLKIQIKLHWWPKMFQKLYTIKMFPRGVSYEKLINDKNLLHLISSLWGFRAISKKISGGSQTPCTY